MPDRAILDGAAEALASHQWSSLPDSAHSKHQFDSACKVCKGDTEAMAVVVLRAVAQRLHGIAYTTNGPAPGTAGGIRFAADLISKGLPDKRASVDDLLGADPNYLGGQSVDDYIREARRDR